MDKIVRSETLGSKNITGGEYKPYQLDPELAATQMARDIIERLGTPSIVSKRFIVYLGIAKGLNDRPGYRTGYDTSLRIAVYEHVASESVNVDGKYFSSLWAYLMKPKFIIQGMPQTTPFEEEKVGIGKRILNFFHIGGKKEEPKP